MNKEEFDKIISLLQNPTRRKILEVLSQEEHYPLKLSRAIDTSQQAVSKHLDKMERHGIVISKVSKSERGGPPTRLYSLNREISVRIDIGPCLFQADVDELGSEDVKGYEDIEEKIELLKRDGDLESRRKLISEINEEMSRLETERLYMLKLKEIAMTHASEYIMKHFDDYRERSILYHVLNTGETDHRVIAKELGVREDEVLRLIKDMKGKTEIW